MDHASPLRAPAVSTTGPARSDRSPWRTIDLGRRDEATIGVGPLTLTLESRDDELQLSHRREGEPSGGSVPAERIRWATRDWDGRVELAPEFPERPVVVMPEDHFRLLSEARARVFIRVPLWVSIAIVADGERTVLGRLPTLVASDTWWGTPVEGELCYHLATSARRAMTPDLFADHLAICPLRLENRSEDDLHVEKIALRVAYLSLYEKERRLWSDETRVAYAGEAEESRLDVAGKPPVEEPGAALVAPPRERMGRGLRARTFARLRNLHWIG